MAAKTWKENAFLGLHYDLHPHAQDKELGRETTYEHIREMLERVKPDYVQYDCKGHAGYTGYPTEIGSPSPGIVNDALKVWREVTRDMGIPLLIHYSGVWDTRAVELHPEWARIDESGNPSPHYTDPLSDYTHKFMIPQLLEVVDKYDIDGVWIDGENWASHPSWSEKCIQEFQKRTGLTEIPRTSNDPNWKEWLAFHRQLFTEHVDAYTRALHEKKPTLAVCSNWMYSFMQPDPITVPVDFLSGDFDPSFGAERARLAARFFASRNKPWDLMAWAFLRTGEQQWTMKSVPHLCQELAVVLSQGGGVCIYNQPQRSGRLTEWHQELLAEVARFCRRRQEWSFKTSTVPQIAVLYSYNHYYAHNQPLYTPGNATQPAEGAIHALTECGYSVDVMNEDDLIQRCNSYPIVVIPEQQGLPKDFQASIVSYVQNGGNLILTGASIPEEWGQDFIGVRAINPPAVKLYYIPAQNGAVPIYGEWCEVESTEATSLVPLLYQQEPSFNSTSYSAATIRQHGKGKIITVPGPLFRAYSQAHYPRMREFVRQLLITLDAPNLLIHHDGPPWVEVVGRQKEGRLLIQLVNLASANPLSPTRHYVEEVPVVADFRVIVPLPAPPKRCYLAPDDANLVWNYEQGKLTVKISHLYIHNVLVIEKEL